MLYSYIKITDHRSVFQFENGKKGVDKGTSRDTPGTGKGARPPKEEEYPDQEEPQSEEIENEEKDKNKKSDKMKK
ncbi:MAG: hypothetical protein WD431_07920 [Cyclobacteriaceae bacterium]